MKIWGVADNPIEMYEKVWKEKIFFVWVGVKTEKKCKGSLDLVGGEQVENVGWSPGLLRA